MSVSFNALPIDTLRLMVPRMDCETFKNFSQVNKLTREATEDFANVLFTRYTIGGAGILAKDRMKQIVDHVNFTFPSTSSSLTRVLYIHTIIFKEGQAAEKLVATVARIKKKRENGAVIKTILGGFDDDHGILAGYAKNLQPYCKKINAPVQHVSVGLIPDINPDAGTNMRVLKHFNEAALFIDENTLFTKRFTSIKNFLPSLLELFSMTTFFLLDLIRNSIKSLYRYCIS